MSNKAESKRELLDQLRSFIDTYDQEHATMLLESILPQDAEEAEFEHWLNRENRYALYDEMEGELEQVGGANGDEDEEEDEDFVPPPPSDSGSESSGRISAQGSAKFSAQGSGRGSAQSYGRGSAQGSGKSSAQGSGKSSAQNSGRGSGQGAQLTADESSYIDLLGVTLRKHDEDVEMLENLAAHLEEERTTSENLRQCEIARNELQQEIERLRATISATSTIPATSARGASSVASARGARSVASARGATLDTAGSSRTGGRRACRDRPSQDDCETLVGAQCHWLDGECMTGTDHARRMRKQGVPAFVQKSQTQVISQAADVSAKATPTASARDNSASGRLAAAGPIGTAATSRAVTDGPQTSARQTSARQTSARQTTSTSFGGWTKPQLQLQLQQLLTSLGPGARTAFNNYVKQEKGRVLSDLIRDDLVIYLSMDPNKLRETITPYAGARTPSTRRVTTRGL